MRFAFIDAWKTCFPVALMCRVLRVSRSGYYASRGRPQSKHALEDQRLLVKIKASHEASRGAYGSPRVHRDLREDSETTGRARVAIDASCRPGVETSAPLPGDDAVRTFPSHRRQPPGPELHRRHGQPKVGERNRSSAGYRARKSAFLIRCVAMQWYTMPSTRPMMAWCDPLRRSGVKAGPVAKRTATNSVRWGGSASVRVEPWLHGLQINRHVGSGTVCAGETVYGAVHTDDLAGTHHRAA